MTTESAVQEQVNAWKQAVISQDIEKIMSHYESRVRAFDAVAALQFAGRESYAEHWRNCLGSCTLSAFEIAGLQIEAEGGMAVCSFLNRCGGVDAEGKEQSCWMRATQVYRNVEGRWRIVHEHFSAPFDMNSGEVLFGLSPESSS